MAIQITSQTNTFLDYQISSNLDCFISGYPASWTSTRMVLLFISHFSEWVGVHSSFQGNV
jgi:hypothetical protein